EMTQKIAKHGWDLARVQDYLFAARAIELTDTAAILTPRPIARGAGDIHPIATGGAGVKMTYLPLWAGGTLSVTRALRNLGS
ncbi:MAG: hypothetical protein QGF20_08545, partial [Alphaproteobacteria bacterium]|nr:hypothetical protein [Alphaproteobacteria bacterium]